MSLSADADVAGVSSVSTVRSSVVPAGYTAIRTAEDLMKIADNLSGKYILTGDIDLSSVKNWACIGGLGSTFTGVLDGNGHTIKNLDMSGESAVSLFYELDNAEVKNLNIDNFTLGDNASGGLAYRSTDCSISNIKITNLKKEDIGDSIGGLVVYDTNSTIKNCSVSSSMTIKFGYGNGGLIGTADGTTINSCTSSLNLDTTGSTGGLIGCATDCTVTDSNYNGKMTSSRGAEDVGGLIGRCENSTVSNCSTITDIDGNGYRYGGLIGSCLDSKVTNCFTKGNVSGEHNIGGLIGRCENSTVSNCSALTDIDSKEFESGGLIGRSSENKITNCFSKGNVSGGYSIGGLIGKSSDDIEITDCYHNGNVTSSNENFSQTGGLIGSQSGSSTKISNCYSVGNVSGNSNAVGGLIGSTDGTISNCYSKGNVKGGNQVGGLIGSAYDGTISNCYSKGDVKGEHQVGGFIGSSNDSISNCYSEGTVIGVSEIGGFVGYESGTITDSYSLGYVEGISIVGGFAGSGHNISNCFSKGDVKGESTIGGFLGQGGGVSESYCEGNVEGINTVGGFAGTIVRSSDCYAKGDVTASVDGGGFAWVASDVSNSYFQGSVSGGDVYGFSYLFYDVSDVFFDADKAGTDKAYKEGSGTVTGLSSSEMRNEQNFIDAGWDETIWFMNIAPPTLVKSPKAYDADFNIRLQVGADSSKSSCIHVNTYIEMDNFSVDFSSAESCASAIDNIDELLNTIGKKMSDFGAVLNRLDSVLSSQTTTIENLTASKSTIMDADIAKESAEFVKNQILQQTTSALLVQAQSVHSSVIMAMIR